MGDGEDCNDGWRPYGFVRGPLPYEEALIIGGNFRRLPNVTRVRLVRCKEPCRV